MRKLIAIAFALVAVVAVAEVRYWLPRANNLRISAEASALKRPATETRVAMAKAGEAWVNPYVTDGLIAMYDGEWNAGAGVHDSVSCKNIISDNWHGTVGSGVTIGSNYFQFNGVKNIANVIDLGTEWFDKPNYMTAEVCYEVTGEGAQTTQSPFGGCEGGNFGFQQITPTTSGRAYWCSLGSTPSKSWSSLLRMSNVSGGINSQSVGIGSDLVEISNYNFTSESFNRLTASNDVSAVMNWSSSYKCFIGCDAYNPIEYVLCGKVYCVRFYNRLLTEAELRANAAVDRARFNLP